MLRAIYDPAIQIVPADSFVQSVVDGSIISYYKHYGFTREDMDVYINSNMEVLAYRVAIKEGRIRCTDIVFIYKGEELYMDKNARMDNWPEGFCDTFDKLLDKLL